MLKSLELLKRPGAGRRPSSYSRAQSRLQTELQLGRLVGILENYLLIKAVRDRKPILLQPVALQRPLDPMTRRLQGARKNFAELVAFWKTEFSVDLKAFTSWSRVEDLRHLRHVLVHRLGMWQPALDPQPKLKGRVQKVTANPDLYRGPVPVAEGDLKDGYSLTFALVGYVKSKFS